VLDVTIRYPHGTPTFWDLMQGRCREVEFVVKSLPLPARVLGAADVDAARAELAPWVETLWREKDARLAAADRLPAAAAEATEAG
jgi:hypothetical protein